jgi:hypothetical protein
VERVLDPTLRIRTNARAAWEGWGQSTLDGERARATAERADGLRHQQKALEPAPPNTPDPRVHFTPRGKVEPPPDLDRLTQRLAALLRDETAQTRKKS